MAGEANSARLIIQLPEKLRKQVEQLAKKDDRSLSAIARYAIEEYVEAACGKNSK